MENNEFELYRTVSIREKEELQRRLVKARCSYLEKWKKLSIFKRRDFGGAKEVCVIYVNSNQREQANAVLEEFLGAQQARRKRRKGGRRGDPRRREMYAEENAFARQAPEPVVTPVEKVSPSSYDPYSVPGGNAARQEEYYEDTAADLRPGYLQNENTEILRPVQNVDDDQEGYVLGDEYAEYEYAENDARDTYAGRMNYSEEDFEDDYSENNYPENSYSEEDYDDNYDDYDDDYYEDAPQYGERRVMLINEDESDKGYFLDDGPRLRGTTRVKGGEGSNPIDEFVDDFNFE